MMQKTDLIALLKKEFATTLKVMRAFPVDQAAFRPHERSSDALKLMSTFVFEMYLCAGYAFGDAMEPARFQNYQPAGITGVISDFEKETAEILRRLADLSAAGLDKKVAFGGATFTVDAFILMMLHDQIHHRGQLSVYVRLAGGKVPSIYGPSADDESTNL